MTVHDCACPWHAAWCAVMANHADESRHFSVFRYTKVYRIRTLADGTATRGSSLQLHQVLLSTHLDAARLGEARDLLAPLDDGHQGTDDQGRAAPVVITAAVAGRIGTHMRRQSGRICSNCIRISMNTPCVACCMVSVHSTGSSLEDGWLDLSPEPRLHRTHQRLRQASVVCAWTRLARPAPEPRRRPRRLAPALP